MEGFDLDPEELDDGGLPGLSSQVENVNAAGVIAKEQSWLMGSGLNRRKTEQQSQAQQLGAN